MRLEPGGKVAHARRDGMVPKRWSATLGKK